MNIFNRLLAIVVLLILIGLLIGALFMIFGYEIGFLGNYLQGIQDYLLGLSGWQQVLAAALAIILGLIAIGLIVLELPRMEREERDFLLSSGEGGTITMSAESLERYAESVGMQVSQVKDISCRMNQVEEGLRVRCEPHLLSGTNVQNQVQELEDKIKGAVEHATGVTVASFRMKAKYVSPEKQAAHHVVP